MTLIALHPTKSSSKNHNPKKKLVIFGFFAALFALRTLSPDRHASIFRTHSDTQAAPAFSLYTDVSRHFFDMPVFKTRRHAVYLCFQEVQVLKRFFSPTKGMKFKPKFSDRSSLESPPLWTSAPLGCGRLIQGFQGP